jgi:hypothetical protein
MTTSRSKMDDGLSDNWIKDAEGEHPVLCVPYPDGMMLVVGTNTGVKKMTPKQQMQLGMEFIKKGLRRLENESNL